MSFLHLYFKTQICISKLKCKVPETHCRFIFAFLKTNRKVPNDYQEIEFAFTKANLSFINECTFVFLKCKFVFLIFVF